VDALEHRIDAALDRLPQWEPPTAFSQQLAAAARRQHETLASPQPSMRFGELLERLGNLAFLLVGSGLIAGLFAFVVPWRLLAAQPLLLTLLCVVALLLSGLALTRRVFFRATVGAW
jgi:hypothetical protein